jgi:biotin carboxyl carrier protein
MKKYKVKVNGKTYNVLLEAIEEVNNSISIENKEVKVENKVTVVGDTKDVLSPIQGSVINVLVKTGQKVKKGDVLLLIEAMKLENEVNAPSDCEIVEILVDKGQTVTTNQVVIKIK